MSETNRRKFLAVAGAGAAAGTVGLVAGPAQAATTTRRTAKSAKEGVVAHIAHHESSEISLLVGDREVIVHDRDLVTRILNAAGGK